MAGNPQGGAAPQQNMGQMGNQMQNMRQGMAGMPSQVPGANLAAPGGGMQVNQAGQTPPPQMPQGYGPPQQTQPAYAGPAQQAFYGGPPQGYVPPQGPTPPPPQMARPAVMPQGPQAPISVGASQPYAGGQRPMPMMDDARFQQNPGMTPRVQDIMAQMQGMRGNMARPQVMGNPNAMPVQRRSNPVNQRMGG